MQKNRQRQRQNKILMSDHKAWTRINQKKEAEAKAENTEYSEEMQRWHDAKLKFENTQREKNKKIALIKKRTIF